MKYIKKYENSEDNLIEIEIFKSIHNHNLTKVKQLIEEYKNVNFKNWRGQTPLFVAGVHNDLHIIKVLIEAGADWYLCNDFGSYQTDFFDVLNKHNKAYVIENYPKEYEKYLLQKKSGKYNL